MALSSAYKNSTVSSVSGTTFTSSGTIFASGDVGRLIILTSGSGKLQHRKIVSFTSTTVVEVDHAWDATPWLDTVADVAPSSGDSFAVSYIQSDSTFTSESGVTVSGEQINISALAISGNAYVHITNAQVDLDSDGIEISNGAGLIFGWYKYISGEDSQVRDSCHLIDRTSQTSGGTQMAPSDGVFGMLDIYGGTIVRDNGSINFWRCYHNADSSVCQCRWVNIQCFGDAGLGSRIDGDRSIIMAEQVGARTTLGVCNPRTAVSRVEISSVDCDQAGYVWLDVNSGGPSGRLVFKRLNTINDKVIRCYHTNHTGTNVMEVIGKKSEIDSAPAFIEVGGTVDGSHTFRYGNIISPSFFDATATKVTDSIKTVLKDTNGTIVNTETLTTGDYTKYFARHTDIDTGSFPSQDVNLSDGALYAPYVLNCFAFGKQLFSQGINLEDTFDAPLTLLDEMRLTETNKATIDAYTELETPQKFFDRAYSEQYGQHITGGESALWITIDGNTINAGSFDVVVDATAGSAFSKTGNTITIHADVFVGNITTTGTITKSNGAIIAGTATDSGGSSTQVSVDFTNLTSSNVEIFDNTFTSQNRQTGITGSSTTYYTPDTATGAWYYVINREGYNSIVGSFNPSGNNLSIDGALSQKVQPNGSPMYLASASTFLTVEILPATPRMNLRIGDGTVTVQQAFDEVEDALMTSLGMEWIARGHGEAQTFQLATGSFLFLEGNIRLIRNTAPDVNATINGFAESTDGTVQDGTNGSVAFFTVSDADQISSHQGAVWVKVGSPNSGSTFPTGTSLKPVNNLADALAIAENLGLVEIKVDGALTIDADVSGFRITPGKSTGTLTLDAGGNHAGCMIQDFFVTGTQVGTVQMKDCSLASLAGMQGTYRNVGFGDNLSVDSSAVRFNAFDCYSTIAGATNKPTISLAGTTALEMNVRGWKGGIEIINCTGANNAISLDLNPGAIRLDNTVTAGDIVLRGLGVDPVDDSVGATVSSDGFNPNLSQAEIHAVLDTYTNKDNWKSDVSGLSTFDHTTDQVIASNMRGTDGAITDLTSVLSAISSLNDLSTTDIDSRLTAYGLPTLAQMTSAFTEIKGAGWTTTDTLEAIRDSMTSGNLTASDVWSFATREVTGGTIDTNNDMRGTDGANTVAPDNAGILAAISGLDDPTASEVATEVWASATRSLTDKTDFALSSASIGAIEAALINEGDGQQLIDAILQVINTNLDLPALELQAIASQVRTELATELARIDTTVSSRASSTEVHVFANCNQPNLPTVGGDITPATCK
jgi:hypothetical protein